MYHNYFGLQEQAFSIAVNPRYLYMSDQHREALAHLLYGVKGGGFVLLTGEVGTGKTTIIRCLLEQMPEKTDIAIILNPMANAIEVLSTICEELAIPLTKDAQNNLKGLTDTLHQYLLSNHREGRNTVLLIDEAQLLSAEVLEQIRLLTNLETNTKKLLQIVLVGQPELNDLLAQPRLRQLSQRITARFHLRPLSLVETTSYIHHRLTVAGLKENRNPFTPRIIRRIHDFTGGIPRLINIVCERTLVGAYGHNKTHVDGQIFSLARKEVMGNLGATHSKNYKKKLSQQLILVATLLLLLLGAAGFFFWVKIAINTTEDTTFNHFQNAQDSTDTTNIRAGAALLTGLNPEDTSHQDRPHASLHLFNDYIQAQTQFFGYLKTKITTETHPCWSLATLSLRCEKSRFETWEELKQLNRPVIISLTTPEKFTSHAIIVGLSDKHALVLNTDATLATLSLSELGPQWTGESFYVWTQPEGFTEPLGVGSTSQTVKWVAEQFALIDSQTLPLTRQTFNNALKERIRLFQSEHNLEADGIIGTQTLMKINEILGIDKTLITEFALSSSTPS